MSTTIIPNPFSLRRTETRGDISSLFPGPNNNVQTISPAKKHFSLKRLTTILPFYRRSVLRNKPTLRLPAQVVQPVEVRTTATADFLGATCGLDEGQVAATTYPSVSAQISAPASPVPMEALAHVPAVHFSVASNEYSMNPSGPPTHSILHQHNSSLTPSTEFDIENLSSELDDMFQRSTSVPIDDSLRIQTTESTYIHSSQSISDGEHDHAPIPTESNTSLNKHLWEIVYPSSDEHSNQVLHDIHAVRLTRSTHNACRSLAIMRDDGALSVDTKLVTDTKGLLLYEIVSDLPYRVKEGVVFACEGALRGGWSLVTVRRYQEGYGYIWCANHYTKQQTLLRLVERDIYDPDMASTHLGCRSICEMRKRFLARFF
ncbi:hypothetical protein B0H11DRAFT_1916671 [Mycena galericulata]|nr:hypothetical protein B0H11DRAFT_1916671 [Mycena galericulata]